MLQWQRHIRQLNLTMLIFLLPFLAIKGLRVLEKKVNETQVPITVSSHLTFPTILG